ncbi:MAG TPA: hypothetical protein VGJ51_16245, partial [Candidatus Angelobacter sp.]
ANATFQSVIGNSIFAVRGWFLKSKKSSLLHSPRNAPSTLSALFVVFAALDSSIACISQDPDFLNLGPEADHQKF